MASYKRHLLFIGDEAAVKAFAETGIHREGYDVTPVPDLKSNLREIQDYVDVIVTDLNLHDPEENGKDGLTVLRCLRVFSSIPVFLWAQDCYRLTPKEWREFTGVLIERGSPAGVARAEILDVLGAFELQPKGHANALPKPRFLQPLS